MASTLPYSNAPDAYTEISQLLQLDQMDESGQSDSLFRLSSLLLDSPTNSQHFINLNGFFIVCNVITMASDSSVMYNGLQTIKNVVGGIPDGLIPEDPGYPVHTLFTLFCASPNQNSEYLKAWFQIQIENDPAFPSYFITTETLGYALSCLSPQIHLGWKIEQITDLLILSTTNVDVQVQYYLDLAWEDIRTMETQIWEEEQTERAQQGQSTPTDEANREASRKAREKKKLWIAEMRKAGVGAEYDQTHPVDVPEETTQADLPTSYQSSSGQEIATNEVGANGVELEELRKQIGNQESTISNLTQSNTELLAQTASLKEELEKEEAKRAEYEAKVTNLLGEVEELKKAKETAESEMARLQSDSAQKGEGEQNALREELAGLQGMLEEEKKRNKELEQKVTNLEELQSKLEESEKKVQQLSEQIEAGEAGRSAEQEELKKELEKVNALLQDKEQENIRLSGELKAAKEANDESIAKYSEEIRNLENELGKVKNENIRLSAALESANDGNDAGQALNAALEQANADLDLERRKRSETETELEKLKKSYAELETQSQTDKNTFEADKKQLEGEKSALEEEIKNLRKQLEIAQSAPQTSSDTVSEDALQTARKEWEAKEEEFKATINQQSAEIESLKAKLAVTQRSTVKSVEPTRQGADDSVMERVKRQKVVKKQIPASQHPSYQEFFAKEGSMNKVFLAAKMREAKLNPEALEDHEMLVDE